MMVNVDACEMYSKAARNETNVGTITFVGTYRGIESETMLLIYKPVWTRLLWISLVGSFWTL